MCSSQRTQDGQNEVLNKNARDTPRSIATILTINHMDENWSLSWCGDAVVAFVIRNEASADVTPWRWTYGNASNIKRACRGPMLSVDHTRHALSWVCTVVNKLRGEPKHLGWLLQASKLDSERPGLQSSNARERRLFNITAFYGSVLFV